jgi:hypothetical protein
MTAPSKAHKAALGVRCHSGWAAAILAVRSIESVENLGPPWTEDQKLATLAAGTALAALPEG